MLVDPGYWYRNVKHLPGDWTLYQDIHGLVPNTLFASDTRAPLRYWPREPLAPMRFRRFAAVFQRHVASLADFVASRYRPLFGLTGGVDSRLLLAAFRKRRVSFETVTWRSGSIDAQELAAVERLAAFIGVPHRYVDVSKKGRPSPAGLIAGLNGAQRRGPAPLAESMHSAYGTETKLVFIMGHGAEILRGFYNLGHRAMTDAEPDSMAGAYSGDFSMSKFTGAGRALVRTAFEEFSARADYAALNGLGYDLNDIFYWEHRMGMWSGNRNNKLDVAMPTLIGFNGRSLFMAAFGLPRKRPLTKRLFLELTNDYDPVLARIPLAPDKKKSNRVSLGPPPGVQPLRPLRKLVRRIRKRLHR